MTAFTLTPSVQSIIDEIGNMDREISRLKAQRDDFAAIVKLTGEGRYYGQQFEGLVYSSKGRVVTNWKAVAEHFSPSRQLLSAHTTTGEPTLSLKVEALKVAA
jgi:phage host-nuclease inhibitor protein Gam